MKCRKLILSSLLIVNSSPQWEHGHIILGRHTISNASIRGYRYRRWRDLRDPQTRPNVGGPQRLHLHNSTNLSSTTWLASPYGLFYPIVTKLHILWHGTVSTASLVAVLLNNRTSNVGLRTTPETLVSIVIEYAWPSFRTFWRNIGNSLAMSGFPLVYVNLHNRFASNGHLNVREGARRNRCIEDSGGAVP